MVEKKIKKSKNTKKKIFKCIRVFFVGILLIILAIVFAGLVVSIGIYVKYNQEFLRIKPQSNSTQLVMYDKNDVEIFRGYGAAEPSRIALQDVPEVVKQSTLAAEDLDYYKHGPVDYKSVIRAVYKNWQDSDKQGIYKLTDLFHEIRSVATKSKPSEELLLLCADLYRL